MDISGSYTLYAPREEVWKALLDPEALKRTVPGCESLEQIGENEYAVRMSVGVAGVKGVYDGTLQVLDAQKPDSYRMVVDGAGTRGILHGDGTLHLEAKDASTTVVRYTGQAQLGGAIASVGMRMAGGAANMIIKQYFVRLAKLLPSMPATSEAPSPAMAAMASAPAAPEVTSPALAESEPPQPETSPASEPSPAAIDAPALVNPEMSGVSPGMMPSTSDEVGAQSSQAYAAPATDVNTAPATAAEPAPTPMPEPAAEETPAPEPEPMAERAPMPVDALMPPPTAPIHPPQPASLAAAPAPAAAPVKASEASPTPTPRMSSAWRAGLIIVVLVVVLLIVWLLIRQ
jgi:uncharacterized protein